MSRVKFFLDAGELPALFPVCVFADRIAVEPDLATVVAAHSQPGAAIDFWQQFKFARKKRLATARRPPDRLRETRSIARRRNDQCFRRRVGEATRPIRDAVRV